MRGLGSSDIVLSFWPAAGGVYSAAMAVLIFFALTGEPRELTVSASLITMFFGACVLLLSVFGGDEGATNPSIDPPTKEDQ